MLQIRCPKCGSKAMIESVRDDNEEGFCCMECDTFTPESEVETE